MSAKLDLRVVLAWKMNERKARLSIAEAKELGLKVVDAAGGGGIMWVGTEKEYQEFLAAELLPMPGSKGDGGWARCDHVPVTES